MSCELYNNLVEYRATVNALLIGDKIEIGYYDYGENARDCLVANFENKKVDLEPLLNDYYNNPDEFKKHSIDWDYKTLISRLEDWDYYRYNLENTYF